MISPSIISTNARKFPANKLSRNDQLRLCALHCNKICILLPTFLRFGADAAMNTELVSHSKQYDGIPKREPNYYLERRAFSGKFYNN